MITNNFISRHNGPRAGEIEKMIKKIGVSSVDELIDQTIPKAIRLKEKLKMGDGLNEYEYLNHLKSLGVRNKVYKMYRGNSFSGVIVYKKILYKYS